MISFDPKRVDWSHPHAIAIPMQHGNANPNAFYIPDPEFSPFAIGSFVGDVNQGGACNVNNIRFNPHGNGTHTESVGHIDTAHTPLEHCLTRYLFSAVLISVTPQSQGGDWIIRLEALQEALGERRPEALVVRSLPNSDTKLQKRYSGTNPTYFDPASTAWLNQIGVLHLLTDQPSVDREEDGGLLLAHKAFWGYPEDIRYEATITEMIYVADNVPDGDYVLNLMVAAFVNDASPSKPVLYRCY